jgi:hypothetical protein
MYSLKKMGKNSVLWADPLLLILHLDYNSEQQQHFQAVTFSYEIQDLGTQYRIEREGGGLETNRISRSKFFIRSFHF